MKHPLHLTSLSLALTALSHAGTPDKHPASVAPSPEENPLSFFDGRLELDFQERLRFETRDNNYDFNDHVKSLNDTSFLLQRARLGAKFAPTDWLTFYAQGQSTFEFGGASAKNPTVNG